MFEELYRQHLSYSYLILLSIVNWCRSLLQFIPDFITFAGEPTAIELPGILLLTKLFIPTTEFSPIETFFRIRTCFPTQTWFPILIGAESLVSGKNS